MHRYKVACFAVDLQLRSYKKGTVSNLGKGMFVAIKICLCFSPFKEKHSVTSGTHLQIHNKPLTNTPTNVSDAH